MILLLYTVALIDRGRYMSIKFDTFRNAAASTGGLNYKGTYNATTNSPVLTSSLKNDYYKVSGDGTLAGVTLNINDIILFNQNASSPITSAMFDKFDNTDQVTSVNTQTGAVVLTAANVNALAIASNLSDLSNAVTARTNLGLGTAATKNHGTSNGELVILDATGLPAVDGSQLTGVTATDNTKLAILNNLSDLTSATSGRNNLGLGTAATKDHGTANGELVILDATGLPAVDGSQLTGVTATDNTKLAIASNLSDLNNAVTARTNLGLGTAATKDHGTANGELVILDATGLPAVNGSQLTDLTINIVDDTSPQLGANLDLNNFDLVSTSNQNIELAPDGSGKVTIKGNASGSGQIVLNCENNSHGITLKGPPHSAAASYTLTFPNTDGNADQVLKTDGNGALDWVDQSGGGGGGFTYDGSKGAASFTAVLSYHYAVNTSAASGNITMTLPAAASGGSEIRIKLLNATHSVIVAPATGEKLDTVVNDTTTLSVANQSITLVDNGTDGWEIV